MLASKKTSMASKYPSNMKSQYSAKHQSGQSINADNIGSKKMDISMLCGEVNIITKPSLKYDIHEPKKFDLSPTVSIISEKEKFMDKRLLHLKMKDKKQ